jgi:hypothetical protein
MLSTTSFKHPVTRARIMRASINVISKGYSVDHVRNSNGQAYAAVRLNEKTGRFIVTDRQGRDITKQVANSL